MLAERWSGATARKPSSLTLRSVRISMRTRPTQLLASLLILWAFARAAAIAGEPAGRSDRLSFSRFASFTHSLNDS